MSTHLDAQMAAILAQGKPAEKTKGQDKKFTKEVLLTKFFNPIVDKTKGQKTATFNIRLIPTLDESTPFKELKLHTGLKLGGKWQKFVCLGEDCPLCATEEGLRKTGDKEDAKEYRASDYYVVKVIDRDKEDEGIKFWRFKKKYDSTGVFDKISNLITLFGMILDPENGFDLVINCGLDAKQYSVITSINCVKTSPLSKNKKLSEEWQNEDSVWQDVYSSKTVEYLTDVVHGRAAYWDDAQKKYINPAQAAKEESANHSDDNTTVDSNPLLKDASFTEEDDEANELPF